MYCILVLRTKLFGLYPYGRWMYHTAYLCGWSSTNGTVQTNSNVIKSGDYSNNIVHVFVSNRTWVKKHGYSELYAHEIW